MARPFRPRVSTSHLPVTNGEPRRAVTAINLRHEEKAIVDHLQSWWSLREGRQLSQVDAFSILLRAALANRDLELPADIERPR